MLITIGYLGDNMYFEGMGETLKAEIGKFIKEHFAAKIEKNLTKQHKLKDFNINPIVVTALASGVLGENTAVNIAKVLLYPRVLGTSVSTNFGDTMQALTVRHLGATASGIPGMDIEFEDKVDRQRVIMQLKAGPNTINAGDVKPMLEEMASAYRLQVQNRAQQMPVFAVGITYGNQDMLSSHYRKIAVSNVAGQTGVPIYAGKDFWRRLTGNENFYDELIDLIIEVFETQNYSQLLDDDLNNLALEINQKYFTDNHFDPTKV